MKLLALTATTIGLSLPIAALAAAPFGPGACSALDDGVARQSPTFLSMAVPEDAAEAFKTPLQSAVVDLSFAIASDGTVSAVQVLCASPYNPRLIDAVAQASERWRFLPQDHGDWRVAYRIMILGAG